VADFAAITAPPSV